MSDGFVGNARRGLRIAWRTLRREVESMPPARLLCLLDLHGRSKHHAYKVDGAWQTECRRCKCAMIRDGEKGVWRKK